MDAPDSDNIRTLNPDDPPQVETPPIDVGKTLVDLNKSIGLMSDLFVRFISAQADPAQPFERIQSAVSYRLHLHTAQFHLRPPGLLFLD